MTITIRDFTVRLAETPEERRDVLRLRYDVFIEEENYEASAQEHALREEHNKYDSAADYMAVFHNGRVVATARLITREGAAAMGGFYSEDEFDISKIRRVRGNIVEISRACVAKDYRDNPMALSLLWIGIGNYALKNKVALMFGMVSWTGQDPSVSKNAISYLYHYHLAPRYLRATVRPEFMTAQGLDAAKISNMNLVPKKDIDMNVARSEMTPLLKGYLNLGAATFGDGITMDIPQNSYAALVILRTRDVKPAYQRRFAGADGAFDKIKIKPRWYELVWNFISFKR